MLVDSLSHCGREPAAEAERDIMSKHPFRTAIERGASQAELAGLLAADVVLMAPMLTMPVTGAAAVANVLACAARTAGLV